MQPELALTPVEIERFWDKVIPEPMSGCWLWMATTSRPDGLGYGHIGSRKRGHTLLAHRVSWFLANGVIPDGMYVLHKCDLPPCVNPSHLFIGTQSDNLLDMNRKGRHSKPPPGWGCRTPRKLNEDQAAAMVALYESTGKWRATARQYGVSSSTLRTYLQRTGAYSSMDNPLCVRCSLDRQAHLDGAPGSCSRFRLIRLRAPAGSQPTTRERVWAEDDSKLGDK